MQDVVTVIGADGYIGSSLKTNLACKGCEVVSVTRDNFEQNIARNKNFGTVVWCAGNATNFRDNLEGFIQTGSSQLLLFLSQAHYEHFIFISSTRVYLHMNNTFKEELIKVNPYATDEIYNLTKVLGEASTIQFARANHTILRLSNVVGGIEKVDNSLPRSLYRMAKSGFVHLNAALEGEKDYILHKDAIEIISQFVLRKIIGTYNVASGINIKNADLIHALSSRFSFELLVNKKLTPIIFPKIPVESTLRQIGMDPKNSPSRLIIALEEGEH